MVGLGSFAFHTTLLRSAQALDELPMFFAALMAIYTVHCRTQPAGLPGLALDPLIRRFQLLLVACALAFLLGYFTIRAHSVFLVAYALALGYAGAVTLRVAFADGSPLFRRLSLAAAGCHAFGMLGLWLPEHVWLSCDHPLQALELHALYHICAGLGAYFWMIALVVDRSERVGDPSFRPSQREHVETSC